MGLAISGALVGVVSSGALAEPAALRLLLIPYSLSRWMEMHCLMYCSQRPDLA